MFCSRCGTELQSVQAPCGHCGDHSHIVRIEGNPFDRPGVITMIAGLDLLAGLLQSLAGVLGLFASTDDAVGMAIAVTLLLFGVLHGSAAVGLWRLAGWARALQIGLSIVGLFVFPMGTIISILVLYYLFRPGVRVLFSGKTVDQLTVEDLRAIAAVRGNTAVIVIVVGIFALFACGIISAIAIPNFLNAIDRGKQKRTMADIRTVASGLEKYAAAEGTLPRVGEFEALRSLLEPRHVPSLPDQDGWAHPLQIDCGPDGYVIRSFGKDGLPDSQPPRGPTSRFVDDIVFEDGRFVQWPEGFQQ